MSADERAARSQGRTTHRDNSEGVWALAQPVHADSVVVEQLALVALARPLGDRPQHLYPLSIARGECADGPVAPEEHAVPAEARDGVLHERPQVFRSPSLRIRVSHQTGDLAPQMWKPGDFRDVRTPRIEVSFLNLGYSTVVKDEDYIRAFGNQFDRDGKLPSQNAEVERKAIACQGSHIVDEPRSLAHFVRLGMEHAADSLQPGMTHDLVKVGFEILALGPAASHNALEWIVRLIGKREQMPSLVEHIALINIGFEVHGLHYVHSFGGREIVGHPEGAV